MTATVFISHASEDKDDAVRPIAEALQHKGYNVWYDEFTLEMGDSLRHKIDEGLRDCNFGVVVLSAAFFSKQWPQRELDGLFAKESDGKKVILPVWHNVDHDIVARYSPILAGRLASRTTAGIDTVVQRIERAIAKETGSRGVRAQVTAPFLVKMRIPGSTVCDRLGALFSQRFSVDSSLVDEVTISLYDDFSGIDREASHVQLKGGARWFPDEDPILLLANDLVPELSTTYTALSWATFNSFWYSQGAAIGSNEVVPLRGYEVEILFGQNPSVVKKPSEWNAYVDALLHCNEQYIDDVWWGPTSVGRTLVRSALEELEELKFGMVERVLCGAPSLDTRGRFSLAVAIVEELRSEQDTAAQSIVAVLLGNDSSLNEYWKGVLRKKLGP